MSDYYGSYDGKSRPISEVLPKIKSKCKDKRISPSNLLYSILILFVGNSNSIASPNNIQLVLWVKLSILKIEC